MITGDRLRKEISNAEENHWVCHAVCSSAVPAPRGALAADVDVP